MIYFVFIIVAITVIVPNEFSFITQKKEVEPLKPIARREEFIRPVIRPMYNVVIEELSRGQARGNESKSEGELPSDFRAIRMSGLVSATGAVDSTGTSVSIMSSSVAGVIVPPYIADRPEFDFEPASYVFGDQAQFVIKDKEGNIE